MSTVRPERTYSGKPIALRRAERRAAFLEAGLTLYGDRGFARTSVSDICSTANLARSQFYTEFEDRETLLIGVHEQIETHVRAAVADAMDRLPSTSTLGDVVPVGIEALFYALGTDPRRARVCFVEMNGVSERVDHYRIRRKRVWADFFEMLVRAHIAHDYVPPGGYDVVTAAFTGAVGEVGQRWSQLEPRPPLTELVGVMTSIVGALVPPLARSRSDPPLDRPQ
ncbi:MULTISPECIES: TetR/AcrR family transcriptional regulator [Nocardiaceae]|uniref:TetR/AcrR family transcriptional regulator n=1 Tax=Rhodococcoides kroppenstedtii TaxID=293050 RepID=A0ABS7NT75_9NOCA|nr:MULTISPECIES: TetR/AcrR family transcriptional regulator [Rhodococcus]AMY20676.1 hypothetical protein A3Q40_03315 [Rhodococcus sp. PBTS 1]MBY6313336.1 TetR/AcrR family transcriptional regulator [Rhodococcus kroppenstedtii]MBY6321227.1 TetR/AcrR family transcriptional regulator [Rhodococcus kroppenstedtii]MBY6400354.1 TetR/AcrR family transcriptional regulator [Rhodococcus kroppenstedtii]